MFSEMSVDFRRITQHYNTVTKSSNLVLHNPPYSVVMLVTYYDHSPQFWGFEVLTPVVMKSSNF
jgi:hypothetical protein